MSADLSPWLGRVTCGDCLELLRELPNGCVDAVITDPPYAEVKRDYGRWTEAEWWALMVEGVVPDVRRVLKPTGSAVFIIQPNSRKVGSMRGWVFEFMAWVCREWNMVQDAYWWNYACLPCGPANTDGLLKASLKPCVWCGPPNAYRDQGNALWDESMANAAKRAGGRFERVASTESHHGKNEEGMRLTAQRRGGVTPFNVIPFTNANSADSAGTHGHGAGTPLPLAKWWTRYICPPGGVVLDPFMGSGTMALAAIAEGRDFVGFERDAAYCETANARIAHAQAEAAARLQF